MARALEGGLTASAFGTPGDFSVFRSILVELELHAGRLILNQYPTGVEVGHAIVHGGPYPATSDARTTSVGTRAICLNNVTSPPRVCHNTAPHSVEPMHPFTPPSLQPRGCVSSRDARLSTPAADALIGACARSRA